MNAIDSILAKRLKQVQSPQPGWNVWEHRTLNMHRGVLHAPAIGSEPWPLLADQVANAAGRSFNIRWWRGFGFGCILEADRLPESVDQALTCIDVRARNRGTWQWLVLVAREEQVALGLHTWREGFLSPVFLQLMAHFKKNDFLVGSFAKEPDGLMKLVLQVSEWKGVRYPKFKPG